MLREDLLGGLLQVADPGVVAKAFPKFVEFGGRGFGGSVNRRQLVHPAFPIGDDGFDLGLLEHDFRHIYRIRVRCPSPR